MTKKASTAILKLPKSELLTLLGVKDRLKAIINSLEFSSEEKKSKVNAVFDSAFLNREIRQYLQKKQDKGVLRDIVVSEAIIRPTGLLDPVITLKPIANQVDDIIEQVRKRVIKGQRVLITTLTKRFAEELDIYFKQLNIKSAYIHSDVETLDRLDILADLRRGTYDVLIGINLLREGLDLPEVSLVAIFDADKEGFLRSRTSLIQIIGRAARHEEGEVFMYANKVTDSMRIAIAETERRREIQHAFNVANGITPKSTKRELNTISDNVRKEIEDNPELAPKEDEYTISNKNSRGGKYRDKKGTKSTDRVRYDPGKQIYDEFNMLKSQAYTELETLNLSKSELEIRLMQAIDALNFEEAAAIRDLMNN
jgi:excinuclease UvrABC helicase subunit UvrB